MTLHARSTHRRLLRPDAIFDGAMLHRGAAVLVEGARITGVGPLGAIGEPSDAEAVDLPGCTLLPGLIDLHSHLLLHPYDEASWNDQVLREPESMRVARATVAAAATLDAGFTTLRDLGTEGAGDADVGLQRAIAEGIIPGPRLLIATRAIVARGTYGPRGFAPNVEVPQGAQEASGIAEIACAVREQIARGADWVKLYADYGWGPGRSAQPTFTLAELEAAVGIAHDGERPVAAHASTAEGMRRAALAGVDSIEHGNDGTPDVFALMAERGVAFCPTLAASEAIARYRGWNASTAEPDALVRKRRSFAAARAAGVTIANGSDVGVFSHGTNARELELLVDYGMTPLEALAAATSVAARVLRMGDDVGHIRAGMRADLVAVDGDPAAEIGVLRRPVLVMKDGAVFRDRSLART